MNKALKEQLDDSKFYNEKIEKLKANENNFKKKDKENRELIIENNELKQMITYFKLKVEEYQQN